MKVIFILDSHYFNENHFFLMLQHFQKQYREKILLSGLIPFDKTTISQKLSSNRLLLKDYLSGRADLLQIFKEIGHPDYDIISTFEKKARNAGFKVSLKLYDTLDQALSMESSYSDLLACSSDMPDKGLAVIRDCQCPVLFLPYGMHDIKSIVLPMQEGIEFIAWKQFKWIFPELSKEIPVSLLAPFPSNDAETEKEKLLVEYLITNFSNSGIVNYLTDFYQEFCLLTDSMDKPLVIASIRKDLDGQDKFINFILNRKMPVFLA
ncbi:MAG: hypothetical protein ACK4ND_13355 [Cytophagaceae bacterium]